MTPMLTREEVHARLQAIFPDGAPNRAYLTRMLAASAVFVALYVDAIEGSGTYLGPKHVYRMTDEQAARVDDASRAAYAGNVLRTGSHTDGKRWGSVAISPVRNRRVSDTAGRSVHNLA